MRDPYPIPDRNFKFNKRFWNPHLLCSQAPSPRASDVHFSQSISTYEAGMYEGQDRVSKELLDPNINEAYLFHGTKVCACSIVVQGESERVSEWG